MMDYLAKACGKQDMETAIMKDSGLCVEVGTYCSEEWKPFGCVQKTTGFFKNRVGDSLFFSFSSGIPWKVGIKKEC